MKRYLFKLHQQLEYIKIKKFNKIEDFTNY